MCALQSKANGQLIINQGGMYISGGGIAGINGNGLIVDTAGMTITAGGTVLTGNELVRHWPTRVYCCQLPILLTFWYCHCIFCYCICLSTFIHLVWL